MITRQELRAELRSWAIWMASMYGWVLILVLIFYSLPFYRDDTDPESGSRSGMRPLTDHRTGCQYLMAERGGLTPRLDAKGEHIGCRE